MECANKNKNRSFLATWSNDELKEYKEDEEPASQPIALVAVTLISKVGTKHQEVLEVMPADV